MSKKLIYGIGYNDIDGVYKLYYKEYTIWKSLLKRAYSEKYHQSNPTYKDVTVESEWLVLSNFISWLQSNYVHEYSLDKDLLIQGNKKYSPNTCRYVPQYVNNVLLDCGASRGTLPIGVTSRGKRYRSNCNQIQTDGITKSVHLGYFETLEKAHAAWQRGKIEAIELVIEKYQKEPRWYPEIVDALNNRIQMLRNDIQNSCETKKL